MSDTLEIKCKLQILKPVHEVFEAIVDPVQMSGYFIEKSTGRLESGKTIYWKFPEFDEESPVKGDEIRLDEFISFSWGEAGKEQQVEISLEPANDGAATVVTVVEKSMPNNAEGIKWLRGNTEGWANFLACMKASLEYGINLRRGAFDFMKS